jgi:hypothetical protein
VKPADALPWHIAPHGSFDKHAHDGLLLHEAGRGLHVYCAPVARLTTTSQ